MLDVFINGAGPSGLMMAIECLRHGLTFRIIDKDTCPTVNSRAIVIQPRTLEILNHIGLLDECLAKGHKIKHFIPSSHNKPIADISLDLIDSPYQFLLVLEQSHLESILINYLETKGRKIEREMELISFEQKISHVRVHFKSLNETFQIDASWLIGCDGAHSTIRKGLDLTFEGLSFPEVISLADATINLNHDPSVAKAFFNENELLVIIPYKEKNKYRLIFQLERYRSLAKTHPNLPHGEISKFLAEPPSKDEIDNFVKQFIDPNASILETFWTANFWINSRMVNEYRKQRVFLVGDAAHIHSPVGGQGMNTGLQDAFNLTWKLALVQKGLVKDDLLDSYQIERHQVGKNILKGTEVATRLLFIENSFLAKLRNAMFRLFTSFKFIRKKIVSTISQINITYQPSPWIVQNDGIAKSLAGKRAPNANLIIDNQSISLYDLLKNFKNFQVLLIDSNHHCKELSKFKTFLENRFQGYLKVHLLQNQVDKSLLDKYGDKTIYLIRPDLVIAYCGAIESSEHLIKYLSRYLPNDKYT